MPVTSTPRAVTRLTWTGREAADSEISLTGVEIVAPALRPVRAREYQLLTDAHRARNKGQARAAIRLYRRILVENPDNLEVAMRVAPMLAYADEAFEAWQLYRRVALAHARARRYTECLAVYREACRFVPGEFEAWRLCAELQLKLNRPEGAFETLIEGRLHFGEPGARAQAIALLRRAREIEPWDDDLLLDLAGLYAASDQPELALELLSTLACRVEGRRLRRVRTLQLRLTLSPRYALLWLRTFGRPAADPLPPDFDTLDALDTLETLDIFDVESSEPPATLHRITSAREVS